MLILDPVVSCHFEDRQSGNQRVEDVLGGFDVVDGHGSEAHECGAVVVDVFDLHKIQRRVFGAERDKPLLPPPDLDPELCSPPGLATGGGFTFGGGERGLEVDVVQHRKAQCKNEFPRVELVAAGRAGGDPVVILCD